MLWGRAFEGSCGDGGVALYCGAGEVQSVGSFSSAVEEGAGSIIQLASRLRSPRSFHLSLN